MRLFSFLKDGGSYILADITCASSEAGYLLSHNTNKRRVEKVAVLTK